MLRSLLAFTALIFAQAAFAQDTKSSKPKFLYGHDVKVRNVGEKNFTPMTPKIGVEFFHDTVGNALVAITEAGHIAVIPFPTLNSNKTSDWVSAFELRVRDATVESFKDAKKVAAESFKDNASGKLFIISSQKSIAFADAKAASEQEPAWHHALILKVRGPGDADFTTARKVGVEAFKDATTGGLIYLTDQGFLATAAAPAKSPPPDAVLPPKAITGLKLNARKADEGDFTDKTKAYGVEVYSDPNSGATLFLCETGSLATANFSDVKKGQGVRWSHSFALKARKGGEKDFEKANKYGVEVFEDKNSGGLVYITETGSIAVLKK